MSPPVVGLWWGVRVALAWHGIKCGKGLVLKEERREDVSPAHHPQGQLDPAAGGRGQECRVVPPEVLKEQRDLAVV